MKEMRGDRQTSGNWGESGHGPKRRMGRNKRKRISFDLRILFSGKE
jgi:hypothetical protein